MSRNSIFIKQHGSSDKKKIPLPASLEILKDQCIRKLNLSDDGLTFYNEKTGKVIRSINEIAPSMVISVSVNNLVNDANPFSENIESDPCDPGSSEKMNSINHMKQFRHESTNKEQALIYSIYNQLLPYLSFSATNQDETQNADDQNQIQDDDINPDLFSQFITNITNSGFYNAPGTFYGSFSYRTILVGPPKSGKTTMLKMIAKQIYENLIQANESREVFMLIFDFRKFKKSFSSIENFFKAFMSELIDQLAIQWPLFKVESPNYVSKLSNLGTASSYAPSIAPSVALSTKSTSMKRKRFSKDTINMIKEFFDQFANYNGQLEPVSSKFPKFEPHLTILNALNALGNRISNSINGLGSVKGLVHELSTLPYLISKIFGFKRLFYAFDHIDDVDFEINTGRGNISFISYIKKMISLGSFIISCTDEHKIYDICEPIDNDDVDLKTKSNFVSIIDSFDDTPKSKYYFELTFDNSSKPIILQIEDCGACGGYVSRWREIEPLVSIISSNRNKKEVEKARLKALALLRTLAPMLITSRDSKTMNPEEIEGNLISFEIKM
ncbi:hypothetical protein M9Y10_035117 [Tritrichomonas musculus]|uniref:AAA+ ATPase domain-containing protein n=1 Tax=Tritrichomonas musculus TaxID=1915356 RepID=A0ABR2KIT7_9EUKA